MSTAELKIALIKRITRSENETLLKEVLLLLESDEQHGTYRLTEEQIAAVEEARAEFKAGKFLTDEEDQDLEQWFNNTLSNL